MLRIAVKSPLPRLFDYYSLPGDTPDPGCRVVVPFGRRKVLGVVVATAQEATVPIESLKTILEVVDQEPLLSTHQMFLAQWCSDYYHYPIGEVLFTLLPPHLRKITSARRSKPVAPEVVPKPSSKLPILNEDQVKAVAALTSSDAYQCFLLDGVTGSGKTEVYLRAIAPLVEQGKQVLVLVPEIGLTPQTIQRFEERLPVLQGVWHSNMTTKARREVWQAAYSGQAKVLIGTRSAIFLHCPNLAMIVVDEAHDASFKQQSGLRYSAVDLARVRAKHLDIPVVLGSATPPLACLADVSKRIQHLSLSGRAAGKLPSLSLIDLRGQRVSDGLSNALLAKISEHVGAGRQVLVFLNQRGFAPALICHQCGWIAKCQRCEARLTLHNAPKRLLCHHCGSHWRDHRHCQSCQHTDLMALGTGTVRLEQALEEKFPGIPILRVDRDSTRLKGQLTAKLAQIQENKAQILIGTQMLAKGHHFPNLSLVAVINADDGLFSSDIYALERMGQLLIQVAGRAGRTDHLGEVLIQTHQPDHPLLQQLLTQGYHAFAKAVLQERAVVGLPPYGELAVLRAESTQETLPVSWLQALMAQLNKTLPEGVRLVGPMPALLARKAGYYRYQLLVWALTKSQRHGVLSQLMQLIDQTKTSRKIRWSLDVDPVEMV